MLYDLWNSHLKLMILFHIPIICTLYDIVLPNKYLSLSNRQPSDSDTDTPIHHHRSLKTQFKVLCVSVF